MSPGVFFTSVLSSHPAFNAAFASTRGSPGSEAITFVGHAWVRPTQPSDAVELRIGEVEALAGAGALTEDQANGLTDKRGAVIDSLNRDQTRSAYGQLQAFLNQVKAFIRIGTLSPEEGGRLMTSAVCLPSVPMGCESSDSR